jgi:hypothetical protein
VYALLETGDIQTLRCQVRTELGERFAHGVGQIRARPASPPLTATTPAARSGR